MGTEKRLGEEFVVSEKAKQKNSAWSYWFCITALFTYLYAPTLKWMYTRFIAEDSYYSHGFLIPFITGFLIWQKRDLLKNIQIEYSWWGMVFIVLALLTHLASMVFYVFFPSGFSILFLVVGLFFFLYGKNIIKTVLMPLLFLVFMCPLPLLVVGKIAYPMKLGVASASASIVSAMHIPVFRAGFYIDTAKGQLLVGNPCSGLRSLITFLALSFLLAYLSNISWKKKVFLFILSIPIAFLTNLLRVTFLVLMTNYYGVNTTIPGSLAHDTSGYVVFIIGGIILFSLGKVLEWKR